MYDIYRAFGLEPGIVDCFRDSGKFDLLETCPAYDFL